MFEKKLGQIIREWRDSLGITGEDLGKKLFPDHKSPQTQMSKVETGKRKLSFEEACLLVDIFGKSLNDLHPFYLPKVKSSEDEIFLKLQAIFNHDRRGMGRVIKEIIALFYLELKNETIQKEIILQKKKEEREKVG